MYPSANVLQQPLAKLGIQNGGQVLVVPRLTDRWQQSQRPVRGRLLLSPLLTFLITQVLDCADFLSGHLNVSFEGIRKQTEMADILVLWLQ